MRVVVRRTLWVILVAIMATGVPSRSDAASAAKINSDADATLRSFVRQTGGGEELAKKAAAVLIFPLVIKAGIGFGGEYGEGVLIVHGRIAGYYNMISASFGFQLGAQARSVIIIFMTDEALASFERIYGWKVGIDGSIVIITVGAGGSIDTESLTSPVIGFIFDTKGLMYNLTLEGSKISRISR